MVARVFCGLLGGYYGVLKGLYVFLFIFNHLVLSGL